MFVNGIIKLGLCIISRNQPCRNPHHDGIFFYITYTCYYMYINYLSELLVNVGVFNVTRPSCQLVESYMDAK